MKLFLAALALGVAIATPALPPGYEDQIWCPADSCEIYTNPYGNVGALSSFSKCYNPATDETSEGVWTGSRTDVIAPEGYIEPEMCTGAEYSQCDKDDDCSLVISHDCHCYVDSFFHPFDPCDGVNASECIADTCTGRECNENEAKCSSGSDGMGGTCEIHWIERPAKIPAMCDSNDQCTTKIRSKAPFPATGTDLCGCYASSSIDPFEECEGEDHCRVAKCRSDSCDGIEAYCDIAPDDNGMGECAFRSNSEKDLSHVLSLIH